MVVVHSAHATTQDASFRRALAGVERDAAVQLGGLDGFGSKAGGVDLQVIGIRRLCRPGLRWIRTRWLRRPAR